MNPFKYISNFFKSFSGNVVLRTEEDSDHPDTFWSRLAYRFTHGARLQTLKSDAGDDEVSTARHHFADEDYDESPDFADDDAEPENEPDAEPEDVPENQHAEPVSAKLPWYQRLWRAVFGPSRKEAQAEIEEAQEDLKTFEFDGLYQPSAKPNIPEERDTNVVRVNMADIQEDINIIESDDLQQPATTPNIPEERDTNVVRVNVTDIDRFNKERQMVEDRLNSLRESGNCTDDFYNDVTALLKERPVAKDPERNFLAFMPAENFNNIAKNYVKPQNSQKAAAISLRQRLADSRNKTSGISKQSTPQRNKQLEASASKNTRTTSNGLIH